MYRINVTTAGKYNNVLLGTRYCFFKKSAQSLVETFYKAGCEFTIERFKHLTSDIFCWKPAWFVVAVEKT